MRSSIRALLELVALSLFFSLYAQTGTTQSRLDQIGSSGEGGITRVDPNRFVPTDGTTGPHFRQLLESGAVMICGACKPGEPWEASPVCTVVFCTSIMEQLYVRLRESWRVDANFPMPIGRLNYLYSAAIVPWRKVDLAIAAYGDGDTTSETNCGPSGYNFCIEGKWIAGVAGCHTNPGVVYPLVYKLPDGGGGGYVGFGMSCIGNTLPPLQTPDSLFVVAEVSIPANHSLIVFAEQMQK